jgi:hypothetical protein
MKFDLRIGTWLVLGLDGRKLREMNITHLNEWKPCEEPECAGMRFTTVGTMAIDPSVLIPFNLLS